MLMLSPNPGQPAPFEAYLPYSEVRAEGWTLEQAVFELVFIAIAAQRRWISLHLALADHYAVTAAETREMQSQCWRLLLPVLRNGILTVRGIVDGSRCDLFPEEFDHAEPDFAKNTLTCAGRTYHGVRINLQVVSSKHEPNAALNIRLNAPGVAAGRQESPAQSAMRMGLAVVQRERGGQPFTTMAEAHHATLRHLDIKGEPRGYSIDNFARVYKG